MLTVAMASSLHRAIPPVQTISVPKGETATTNHADLIRCRTLTMPDSGCEAAWEAKRRRFFGKDNRP